jgi:hypothetical protein
MPSYLGHPEALAVQLIDPVSDEIGLGVVDDAGDWTMRRYPAVSSGLSSTFGSAFVSRFALSVEGVVNTRDEVMEWVEFALERR